MPIIVVEVMPKAELLDPQGKAVAGALARQGSRFAGVRIGKRFELAFEGTADDAALADARALADDMLSNSVIEDVVSVRFADGSPSDGQPEADRHGHDRPVGADGPVATGQASVTTSVRGQFADEPGAPA